jgi:hypothetical protein
MAGVAISSSVSRWIEMKEPQEVLAAGGAVLFSVGLDTCANYLKKPSHYHRRFLTSMAAGKLRR